MPTIGPDTTPGILVGKDAYFSRDLKTVIGRSKLEAAKLGNKAVRPAHLLLAMFAVLEEQDGYQGPLLYHALRSTVHFFHGEDVMVTEDQVMISKQLSGQVLDRTFDLGRGRNERGLAELAGALLEDEGLQETIFPSIGILPDVLGQMSASSI